MSDADFSFDAEYALLDVGATSSFLRSGALRPALILFRNGDVPEAVALQWNRDDSTPAFESARRFARDHNPDAYALMAQVESRNGEIHFLLPETPPPTVNEYLALCMFARDGQARGVIYPVRRNGGKTVLGRPTVTDADNTDWSPLGDVWANPFCAGDVVQFKPREKAVDPASPLWHTLVELTRMRMHEDLDNRRDYSAFLDDLRNGVFLVAGRPADHPDLVLLKPRTQFNPLGTLRAPATSLKLVEAGELEAAPV